jgi:hypothetical protein
MARSTIMREANCYTSYQNVMMILAVVLAVAMVSPQERLYLLLLRCLQDTIRKGISVLEQKHRMGETWHEGFSVGAF